MSLTIPRLCSRRKAALSIELSCSRISPWRQFHGSFVFPGSTCRCIRHVCQHTLHIHCHCKGSHMWGWKPMLKHMRLSLKKYPLSITSDWWHAHVYHWDSSCAEIPPAQKDVAVVFFLGKKDVIGTSRDTCPDETDPCWMISKAIHKSLFVEIPRGKEK